MTINYEALRIRALANAKIKLDFRDRWDRDDNRSHEEITVDETLKLVRELIEPLENKLKQEEESKLIALTDGSVVNKDFAPLTDKQREGIVVYGEVPMSDGTSPYDIFDPNRTRRE